MREFDKCPICETPVDDFAVCEYCRWEYNAGIENTLTEEEKDNADETSNPVSFNEAKRLFAQGKNIWGEPLPKKK